jgi:malonyl-CoA decarboxylase
MLHRICRHQHHLLRRCLSTTASADVPLSAEALLLRATAGDPTYVARDLIKTGHRVSSDLIPHTATQAVCDAYRAYDDDTQRTDFLVTLARDMHLDHADTTDAIQAASALTHSDTPDRHRRVTSQLRKTLTPAYETLFSRMLAQVPDGMSFLVDLRADLLRNIRRLSRNSTSSSSNNINNDVKTLRYLKDLDMNMKRSMMEWFSMSFLSLEKVTMDMPGHVLDKIVMGEKVHPIDTFAALRQRLGHGRRCYAFFHPSLPRIPLAFVHVALLDEIADRMDVITGDDLSPTNEQKATAAIFYSISSTQPGLSGVDLGNFLIKRVAKDVSRELPCVTEYSTLSPIPGLKQWMTRRGVQLLRDGAIEGVDVALGTKVAHFLEELEQLKELKELKESKKESKEQVVLLRARDMDEDVRHVVGKAAAHYLYHEKLRGKMMCPVGNFHVRNGAEVWRLNVEGGDYTQRGASNSYGVMVNYKYNLCDVEENNEQYVLSGTVKSSEQFQTWLA